MEASSSSPPATPAVVKWYRAYAAAMAFLYFLVMLMGAALLFMPTSSKEIGMPIWLWSVYRFLFLGLGFVFFGLFLASFFLPRKPWVWVYNIVLICLGLTSACCLPISIPLLIFWLKPECRAYFGKN